MKSHIHWSEEPSQWPVWVEVGKSVDEILATGYLSAEIKAHRVTALGVVLDADDAPQGRYQRIQQLCNPLFPSLPADLPREGMVADNTDGKRLGLWIMPDNKSDGDLETFLKFLVPSNQDPLWSMACSSVAQARAAGAACRERQISKSNLYTWLAWQDPPGQSPGPALTKKILDPNSTSAELFVSWFRRLYQV